MKLLFDQNLSLHLVPCLADLFLGSTHVHEINLDMASDADVWAYALTNGFTIKGSRKILIEEFLSYFK